MLTPKNHKMIKNPKIQKNLHNAQNKNFRIKHQPKNMNKKEVLRMFQAF